MKRMVKKAITDEKGGAFVLTLVLLLIGGLIMAPLLAHMGTGHLAGQVHEKRMDELYAADAGVDEALWWIIHKDASAVSLNSTVNNKGLEVSSSFDCTTKTHTIKSTATSPDISSTTVKVELRSVGFADNAITSRGDVNLGNHCSVNGTIQHGGDLNYRQHTTYDPENTIPEVYDNWPCSDDDLYPYYYSTYVDGKDFVNHYGHGHEIKNLGTQSDPLVIHSTYVSGDLKISGSGWIRLNGTIYLDNKGTLTLNPSGQGIHIFLDGHTVFAEGEIIFGTGGQGINLYRSGSFIAVERIDFKPNASSEDGYVLVLSLKGYVNFQPTKGDFHGFIMSVEQYVNFQPQPGFGAVHGSVVGDLHVDAASHVVIVHVRMSELDIDFPFDVFSNWRLRSYNISLETLG